MRIRLRRGKIRRRRREEYPKYFRLLDYGHRKRYIKKGSFEILMKGLNGCYLSMPFKQWHYN